MSFAFLVPGALDQVTGGYLFDRQVVEGLRAAGREVVVAELAGRYPDADAPACAAAALALARLPDGHAAVIDGLALPAFVDFLAREAQRLRLVGFVHHPLSLETGLSAAEGRRYAVLEAGLWPLLRGVLCPSADTARAVIAAGVPPSRVAVAMPGTRKPGAARPELAPRGEPATGAARSGAPAGTRVPGALRLLAVATVTPRKGHRLLIEALAGLSDLNWQLSCVGSLERDPACAQSLRQAIAACGLAARVTLSGEQSPERLADAYREADLFVLPSFHEGYGMAFAEALAHGLPVVATRAGAIPDTVPSEAGLLVPPGDAAALREALRRVLTDADLRSDLAAGARRAGAALPDWPTAVRRWADEFDRLIA